MMLLMLLQVIYMAPLWTSLVGAYKTTSRLQVKIPESLSKPDGYDHRDAMFGMPPYGGSIQQNVYYADSTLCSEADPTGGYPQRDDNSPWKPPFILLVDRGDCTFVQKVRNAQRAGAMAVLIADDMCLCSHQNCKSGEDGFLDICEDTEPLMADDGSGSDISIPSVLLFKEDADPIREHLKQNQQVLISISFRLPTPDARVEYDLWTTPSDPLSKRFLMTFKEAALALGQDAFFTPHMYIYDGRAAGCLGAEGKNQCFTLCTNNGRYCSTDPDNDLDTGISGADVVTESLRRICIWKRYGDDGIGREWWDYVRIFMSNCYDVGGALFTDVACITEALRLAGIDQESISDCMRNSGGVKGDVNNSMLEDVIKEEVRAGVVIVPSVFVNQAPLRGVVSFEAVFRAVCAGYLDGTQPSICTKCTACSEVELCVLQKGSCEYRVEALPAQMADHGNVAFSTFVASIVIVVLAFGIAGYVYRQREQNNMREHLRIIMADYMPLPES